MSKVTMQREVITPTIAKEYLEANVHNRSTKERLIIQLAGAIERGEWRETAQPIHFNGDGSLVNGQNRLHAIVRAGKRVVVWVARGVPSDAQEVMDTGTKRTIGDMLKLRGYTDVNNLGAVTTVVWHYRTTGSVMAYDRYSPPTPQQLIRLIEDEPMLIDRVVFARRFKGRDPALPLQRRFVGGMCHIFAEVSSEEDAAQFFDELITPTSPSSPAGLARARLLRASTIHSLTPPKVQVALLIKAWNAWIRGERPTRLVWRAGGATKEEFPTVQGRIE